jgi:hypothetical protein
MSFLSDAAQDSGASPPGVAPRGQKQSSPLDILRDAIRKQHPELPENVQMKKGGMTASARADGIAQRGKTKGTMI